MRKNGYSTEDYGFLLFYVPKEVIVTGEVVFDTELVRMNVDGSRGERFFRKALKLLGNDCPSDGCDWCGGV